MWQRVQTLYLGIACFLVASLFFVKLATVIGAEGAEESIRYSEKLIYLLFTIMAITAHVICLLTFKFRLLQMRLAVIAGLMMLGFQGIVVYDFIRFHNDIVFSFTAVFPIVIAILDFIAARNIVLDEAMVQSSARLRNMKKNRR